MSNLTFSEIPIGAEFQIYGDEFLNYAYPKICNCIKDDEDMAHEIDGVSFFMSSDFTTLTATALKQIEG